MLFYTKFQGLLALSLEVSRTLSSRPLLSVDRCDREIIIDMPYTQIILTPWRCLDGPDVAGNDNDIWLVGPAPLCKRGEKETG